MASSGAWSCIQQGCWPSQNSKQIFKIFKFHLAKFPGTKPVRMSNAFHTCPCTFPSALQKTICQVKKICYFTQYYPLWGRDDTIFRKLCICSIGWVPVNCKHSSTSYLHSTAPMQRTPQGWCKDCCLLWSLSSGRKQASSSSCCQHHWATLAPSFLLCAISLCVIRAVAVVSCQWPVPKVPYPITTWSYLALPSCHPDIFSGCRSWTYTT